MMKHHKAMTSNQDSQGRRYEFKTVGAKSKLYSRTLGAMRSSSKVMGAIAPSANNGAADDEASHSDDQQSR